MATRIDLGDIARIMQGVRDALWGEECLLNGARLTCHDGVEVFISGWGYREGWSRGFIVSGPGDSTHPKHDEGRYCGHGWHQRMVKDILDAIKACRASR